MESQGKIWISRSLAGASILFVHKADGHLRPYVDYSQLSAVIILEYSPLPLIKDLQDRLEDANIFTKLDLRNG